MSDSPRPLDSPRLLVVEGPNDKHVLFALSSQRDFQPEFRIEDEGSYEKLKNHLSTRLKPTTTLSQLGIIVDADTSLSSRWQDIQSTLKSFGYEVPEEPDRAGTVIEHGILPRVGIWVMPDNASPGILEDFYSTLIPAGDAIIQRARWVVGEIPVEERRFTDVKKPKAVIFTWLAWQKNPGLPPGLGISAYLKDEVKAHPNVDKLLAWLSRVFN